MAWTFTSNNYDGRTLTLTITETLNADANASVLNWTLVSAGGSGTYYAVDETTIKIDGNTVYTKPYTPGSSHEFPAKAGSVSGTISIIHNDDGTKTNVPIVFKTNVWYHGSGVIPDHGGTINLTPIPTYTLSTSADAHSSIVVQRTSSGYASTGVLNNNARIYSGDTLKITFSADDNYAVLTHTVNGSVFNSGNTHTVSGNVTIVATSQVLASDVGASDAEIGSVSTIIVTKYNSTYYHSLQYTFGELSGYISSSGNTTPAAMRFKQSTVAFTVPSTFYSQLPNSTSGECTITCRTYKTSTSNTPLGEPTTCTFTVSVPISSSLPEVSGTVVDVHPIALYFTGDENVLIRDYSMARCTISATAASGATIAQKLCNNVEYESGNVMSLSVTDSGRYVFTAIDSRGLSSSYTVTKTVIPYVRLTCNPIIKRTSPTDSTMQFSARGNFYNGSFGAHSNNLTLRYRYREVGAGNAYGSWTTIDNRNITFTSTTYQIRTPITLAQSFDYQKSYQFQVNAYDGDSNNTISDITTTLTVQLGLPIFDWGENDFNINVDLKLKNVNILDIIYPVGSIYMNISNTLPATIASIGTWVQLASSRVDFYCWQRTA